MSTIKDLIQARVSDGTLTDADNILLADLNTCMRTLRNEPSASDLFTPAVRRAIVERISAQVRHALRTKPVKPSPTQRVATKRAAEEALAAKLAPMQNKKARCLALRRALEELQRGRYDSVPFIPAEDLELVTRRATNLDDADMLARNDRLLATAARWKENTGAFALCGPLVTFIDACKHMCMDLTIQIREAKTRS